jgi:hypothetical protein
MRQHQIILEHKSVRYYWRENIIAALPEELTVGESNGSPERKKPLSGLPMAMPSTSRRLD